MVMPRSKITRRILFFFSLIPLSAAVVYVVGGGFYGSFSICGVCGARQYMTEWFWFFPRYRVESSPLSLFVEKEGIVSDHVHQWLLIGGSGGGIGCALGKGHQLVGIDLNERYLRFLQTIVQYRGIEESRHWLKVGLNLKQTRDAQRIFGMEEESVQDQVSFERWFSERLEDWKVIENER